MNKASFYLKKLMKTKLKNKAFELLIKINNHT